jgi:hypothetical protein
VKIRKFEIIAVEDRGNDFYVITYRGIVRKYYVTGELNVIAKNEASAREQAELRWGDRNADRKEIKSKLGYSRIGLKNV